MASSDAGFMMSDRAPRRSPFPSSSGARPRAPPSESNIGPSDDEGEGFADDQVPRSSRRPGAADVPRVEDRLGLTVQESFEDFVEKFTEDPTLSEVPASSAATTDKYYIAQIHNMKEHQLSTFYVDFQHLLSYQNGGLADGIMTQYYRFLPFLTSGLHNMIAKHVPQYYNAHRQATASSNLTTSAASNDGSATEASAARRTSGQQTDKLFAIAFYNLPLTSRIRSLRAKNIGMLLSISGTVTRTSEVRPELSMATFICEACRTVVPNVEQTFRYTEPTQCPNDICANRQAWRLDIRQSTFVDWQKVRIQENSSEIPTGSMPRTMDVILRGEMVDRAKAGEKCVFTGALIVVPDVSQLGLPGIRPTAIRDDKNAPRGNDAGGNGVGGLKALGVRDLTYRLAFLACMVTPDVLGNASSLLSRGSVADVVDALTHSPSNEAQTLEDIQHPILASMNDSEIQELRDLAHRNDMYPRLVKSIAPTVYGHEVVKKGILLQLLSGVSKSTPEGMQLRGDINVCIVGDPSTSKSQFLKYVCSFAPRAVYTSGKASSAAGLTAAVVKDEETGEFTIEAGALMLADNGICAIDEFDKMDIADQVAIHEAMEQQTISIAKAGIQATLNARTSILAAANPVGGRYNRKTTLRANINMSAPIMSRFDLFFVILDECNEQIDRRLADHIVGLHQHRDDAIEPELSTETLQRYIRFARTLRPEFTEEAKEVLVQKYKELRADDAQGGIGRNSYRITVRQLESMIRLSEAIAKANCEEDIEPEMVVEAYNLLRQSIISVEQDDVEMDDSDDEQAEDEPEALRQAAEGAAGGGDMDEDSDDEDEAPQQPKEATPQPRAKHVITADKYNSMVNLFVHRLNQNEGGSGEGVEAEALAEWYLEQKEDEIDGEEQYNEEMVLAKKVLKRMVKGNIIMEVRGEGLVADDGSAAPESDRVVYVVHPNCVIDD